MSTPFDLFIVRHAIAFQADAKKWPDDGERPLTPEGIESFRRAARGLRRVAAGVDIMLSSPMVRARQTADIVHEEAGWPTPQLADELEAGRASDDVLKLLGTQKTATVAIVGHEPQLSEIVELLCGGVIQMKKGAVARLRVKDPHPDGGELRWLLPPKVLRNLG